MCVFMYTYRCVRACICGGWMDLLVHLCALLSAKMDECCLSGV